MFIGRERELASLKEFYEKDGQEDYFYTATKVGKNRNLELFSKQVVDLLMPGVENISFHTTEAVFDFIDKNIGDEKLVLVLSRLTYLLGFSFLTPHFHSLPQTDSSVSRLSHGKKYPSPQDYHQLV